MDNYLEILKQMEENEPDFIKKSAIRWAINIVEEFQKSNDNYYF